jgi:hypothetical protein
VNRIIESVFAGLCLGTIAFMSPARAVAQSAPEPAVVISIAGMDKQMAMIEHMLTASGFPEFKFFVQSTVKQYTKGLNAKKPAGVMLFFNEGKEEPDVLGFIPVSNLDDLLDIIAGFVEVDENGDDIIIAMDNGTELNVRKVGDIAFITNDVAIFDLAPADPEAMLEDLPAKYHFAAKVYGSRIPEALRNKWMAMIRDGYEQQMEMMGQQDSLQADLQEMNWSQFERALNDMGTVLMGMATDKAAKNIVFDMEIVAEASSEMAKRFNEANLKSGSEFQGFLMDGAAMTAHFYSGIVKEEADQYNKLLDKIPDLIREQLEDEDLTDEEIEILVKLASGFGKVISDTVAEGKADGGAVLMVEDDGLNFASGLHVANPKELENLVKELVPQVEQRVGSRLQVELNSGSYRNVTFHRVTYDIPDDQEPAIKLLGEQLQVIVGIGEKSAYFAAGGNPLDLLKKAMDDAGPSDTQPAFQMNFYLAPVMKLVGRMEDSDPMAKKMAKKLAETGGDRVRMTYEYLENSFRGRFEIQDGILSLIKVGVDAFSGGGMDEDWEDDDF